MEGPTSFWGSRNRKHALHFRNMMMFMIFLFILSGVPVNYFVVTIQLTDMQYDSQELNCGEECIALDTIIESSGEVCSSQ
jgi:hypothetical protein